MSIGMLTTKVAVVDIALFVTIVLIGVLIALIAEVIAEYVESRKIKRTMMEVLNELKAQILGGGEYNRRRSL